MKHVILLAVILISGIASAQNQIDKEIGQFSQLKVYDLIEVELVKATDNKAIITGNNTDAVIIVNKNGILKIKMNIGESFDGNKTKVILHYTDLDVIDANEGAKIFGKDVITQFEIDLRAQEGGTIQIPLNVTYAIVKAVTGGQITVTGNSKSQKVSVLTGGIYNGEKLETDKTEVSINAGGEAHVKASQLVDAKVRAGGDISIYGNPETIYESTALGGRINKVK